MKSDIRHTNKIRPFDISLFSFGKRMLSLILRREILIREALECAGFYFTAYGVRRLWATLPRSGHNFILLAINVAWDITHGGTGDYSYQEEDWKANRCIQSSFDWRTPLKKMRPHDHDFNVPLILHTHLPYHHIENLQKGNMKTAVLVRNLFDHLESRLFHAGYNAMNQDEFLRSGYVDFTIGFFNSWGKFLQSHKALLVKYEDVIHDSYEAIKDILYFWELDLPESSIRSAITRCTREEMIRRIPQEELAANPRISTGSQKGVFFADSVRFIKNKIKKDLRYNLGYDYSKL